MTEKAHGRTETRRTHVYELADPADVGLFGALTLLKTDRERTVHKTGQTSAETEAPQEAHPTQAVFLVVTQFAGELRRRFGGFDAVEFLELGAQFRE